MSRRRRLDPGDSSRGSPAIVAFRACDGAPRSAGTAPPPARHAPRRHRRRGYALLVVLGALTLMAVLIVGLSGVVRLEQAAAANELEETRARLVADAGLERALFLLTEHELTQPLPSIHAPWAYRSQTAGRWGLDTPLETARNPSFKEGVTATGVAYSGWVSTTYSGGDLFALRVVDLSSRLSVNGPQPTLAATLDALGRAIRDQDVRRRTAGDPMFDAEAASRPPVRDPVAGRGAAIVALRDALGGTLTSLDPLEALLGPDDVEALRHHVTTDAWRDPVRGLCPINVNTASWPVLVACLEGIEGTRQSRLYRLDGVTARWLADQLELRRADPKLGPLTGPQDLETFLERGDILTRLEEAEGDPDVPGDYCVLDDIIRTNADPFVLDTSRNPDATHLARGLDRKRMRTTTVPFCYLTYGLFEITSLGRVFDGEGKELAQACRRATVQVYDVHRLTTQEDFEVARTEDDPWQVESYPNPVGALAGPRRYDPPRRTPRPRGLLDAPEPPAPPPSRYSVADPEERRRLRWRVADAGSGYLQAAPNNLPEGGVVFRFDGDLQSERGDLPQGSRPVPFFEDAIALGVDPFDLGQPLRPAAPTPEERDPENDGLNVDGLALFPGAGEVRYQNDGTSRASPPDELAGDLPPPKPTPILTTKSTITLRFKLGPAWDESIGWTPLLEGRLVPDETYGAGGSGSVDLQVEGKFDPRRGAVLLRTRIGSTVGASVGPVPGVPPELDPRSRVVEQHLIFPGGEPGDWHVLTMPIYGNAHVPLVDGQPGQPDPLASAWPAPAWPGYARGTIAPGGYDAERPPFVLATIDDLIIMNTDDATAAANLAHAVNDPWALSSENRFEKLGPDLMGSFRGELPPFPRDVRLGAFTWAEFLPAEGEVFMVQVSVAHGAGALRRQVSPSQRRPPTSTRLQDPTVRYWWVRHLLERRATLGATLAHTQALLRLATGDPSSQATFATDVALLQQALDDLDAMIATVEAIGAPPEPLSAQILLGADDQLVRFQVDLLHLGGTTPEDEEDELDHSPAVGEVLLLYQDAPRVLRLEDE